ncbi:MAG: hypothetical protein ABSA26_18800 [Thermoguttaceae bacterium]|jgi:hypothetical protein
MTVEQAINIAWGIGKFTGESKPTVQEALKIIDEQLRTCGFNWLTGQAAKEVLLNADTD